MRLVDQGKFDLFLFSTERIVISQVIIFLIVKTQKQIHNSAKLKVATIPEFFGYNCNNVND